MKVAVQGASGFVGSRLVEWLHLRRLTEVVPIVRSYSSLARVARFDLDWKLADALDEDALTEAFEGCEIVFHTVVGPADTILQSPTKTVQAALKAGVRRVVYISTGVAYGFNPHSTTNDESKAVTTQAWGYNRAKARAELQIGELRSQPGVDFVVLIPTIVYGPRSNSWTIAIARDLLRGNAYLVDEGKGICNSIYVDNLVNAMWLAGTVPEARNQDFIVSDKERVTWWDLYRSVADAVDVPMDEVRRISKEEALAIVAGNLSWKSQLLKRLAPVVKRRAPELALETARRLRRGLRAARGSGFGGGAGFRALGGEEVAVQLCDFQMPIEKAQRILGYDPIPFDEATRRTATWLQASGFSARPAGSDARSSA